MEICSNRGLQSIDMYIGPSYFQLRINFLFCKKVPIPVPGVPIFVLFLSKKIVYDFSFPARYNEPWFHKFHKTVGILQSYRYMFITLLLPLYCSEP